MLTIVFTAAAPCSAQAPARQLKPGRGVVHADTASHRPSFGTLVLPATAGSLAGSVVGARFGLRVGWGGGDDPGLASALVFGMLGGALGSATGAWLMAQEGEAVDFGPAVAAGSLGILGGIAGAWVLGEATGGRFDYTGLFVGFSIGQGALTAAIASALAR